MEAWEIFEIIIESEEIAEGQRSSLQTVQVNQSAGRAS